MELAEQVLGGRARINPRVLNWGPHSPFVPCWACPHSALWWAALRRLALVCFREMLTVYTSLQGLWPQRGREGHSLDCWPRTHWEQTP